MYVSYSLRCVSLPMHVACLCQPSSLSRSAWHISCEFSSDLQCVCLLLIYIACRGGGLGSSTIFKNLMSPTPRRKWYLTTGRRAHYLVLDPIPQSLPVDFFGSRTQPPTSHRMSLLVIYVAFFFWCTLHVSPNLDVHCTFSVISLVICDACFSFWYTLHVSYGLRRVSLWS